jgi:MFS family permease
MSLPLPRFRSHLTLALATILHAFTHAYAVMLVPLFLLMREDLHLRFVSSASLIVTVYGLTYSLGSWFAGVLADRFSQKLLLGMGLLGNALAIAGMGLTRQYEMLIVLGVLAGAFGTLFHPTANAFAPAHYPKSPGMAIGLLGMGSGLGFFLGPQFSGWRAESAQWRWGTIANWQKPCVELGIIGIACGILFLLLARDPEAARNAAASGRRPATDGRGFVKEFSNELKTPPLGSVLRWRVVWVALILMFRDFAGIASQTLLSLYLQRAFGYDAKRAGFNIGSMMLLGIVANPLAVWLSPRGRRLPALALVLIAGAVIISLVPFFGRSMIFPLMCAFQAFQLGSYAISDAAMLERVAPAVRGRVVGLFLTIAGTFSAMSPFAMGYWVDLLGLRASMPSAYIPLFVTLGVMLVLAAFSAPLIDKLGIVQGPRIEPISETMPRTVEVLG